MCSAALASPNYFRLFPLSRALISSLCNVISRTDCTRAEGTESVRTAVCLLFASGTSTVNIDEADDDAKMIEKRVLNVM